MLSDFYNLVLESERNTCFKDKHGKRVTGCVMSVCLGSEDLLMLMLILMLLADQQCVPG